MSKDRAQMTLSLLALAVAVFALFWVSHQVNASGRKFCAVIEAATAHPVPRPADPKANPSRESNYEFYVKFVQLGQRLGCG